MIHKFLLFEKDTDKRYINVELIIVHPWYDYISIKPEFALRYANPKDSYGSKTIFILEMFLLFGFGLHINKKIK